ncbi:MAG: hypothetical protein WC560_06575 [Syntrophales bacterium]
MLSNDIKVSELIALLVVFLYAFFPVIPDIFRAFKKKETLDRFRKERSGDDNA